MSINVGDIVWVGEPGAKKTTWRVTSIRDSGQIQLATIKSGQTGRSWIQPVQNLTLHTKHEDQREVRFV